MENKFSLLINFCGFKLRLTKLKKLRQKVNVEIECSEKLTDSQVYFRTLPFSKCCEFVKTIISLLRKRISFFNFGKLYSSFD